MAEIYNYCEVLEKYAGNDLRGRKALKERVVKEFSGFPTLYKNGCQVSLQFTPESVAETKVRILDRVERIAEQSGISLDLAEKGVLPLHVTYFQAKYEGVGEGVRDEKFLQVAQHEYVKTLPRELAGLSLEFKYLLTDGGNLLLTCADIPESLVRTRSELADVYREHGLNPTDYRNILHITVARITRLPVENYDENIKDYLQNMRGLRRELSANPLQLVTAEPYIGPNRGVKVWPKQP